MESIIKGALYIVSTPIGNLLDITYRAVHILKHVDVILCEDTRVSQILFKHYDIQKPYQAFHKFNEVEKTALIISELKEEKTFALISDAGTPLISDPGYPLVQACIENQIRVVPIGGSSALLHALVASNVMSQSFYFAGFLPKKEKALKDSLDKIKNLESTLIVYESPNRIQKTLITMLEIFGDRNITLARELTKKHETFTYTTLSKVNADMIVKRGEYVILIEGFIPSIKPLDNDVLKKYTMSLKKGHESKEIMKSLAREYGVSKRDIYQLIKVQEGNDYE